MVLNTDVCQVFDIETWVRAKIKTAAALSWLYNIRPGLFNRKQAWYTERSEQHCSQAETHLIPQIIALIDYASSPSLH